LASPPGNLHGEVFDPLGGVVPNAKVMLIQNEQTVASTTTDAQGAFAFSVPEAGRYRVHVEAAGFQNEDSPTVFVSTGDSRSLNLNLRIGTLAQQVVVTATGTDIPETQVGASVSVIDQSKIEDINKPDVLEDLRIIPGVQVVQTGQRGGTTLVSIRGGQMDFNKVLMDGIPMNDIGGSVDFGNISTAGVANVEILRGANSVLYGSDALSGVINMTSPHGTYLIPQLTYQGDGGNLGTYQNDVSLAGAIRRFDYFSEFGRFDTENDVPNNAFHNATYQGNFGWAVNGTTGLRFTLRHTATGLGDPNAIDFFGVPDLGGQSEHDTYFGLTFDNQTTPRWHNLVRYASTALNLNYFDPAPAGTPFEGNFIGNTVAIRGANGYSVTGRAILDFGGTFPQTFDEKTTRRSIYAQSDYQFSPKIMITGGFRYENENGYADSPFAERNNFSYFLEGHGSLFERLYVTAGVGIEDNAVFGVAPTPRVSVAYYVRRPTTDEAVGDTKLTFNYGKGIKEPSIFDAGSSLFSVLSTLAEGPALISQFGISPLGPERSTSYDFGISQALWQRRALVTVDFFHNEFFNLIEFLESSTLPLLGLSPPVVDAVAASSEGGATVNSESYRARGVEVHAEAHLEHGLLLGGNYTYLDPVVTQTFASTPLFNPAFPGIPIGAISPLVGNRPFRLSPNSGSLFIDYSRRKWGVTATGYLVSRSDDSTFLTDQFGGTSMLLPNRDLNGGYQKIDVSARYKLNSAVALFASAENVLNEHYTAAFGFPSLPFTIRAGVRITIGGEGWRPR
jgi:iron complex outermembrane receptor protein/vitamin B12 transporter